MSDEDKFTSEPCFCGNPQHVTIRKGNTTVHHALRAMWGLGPFEPLSPRNPADSIREDTLQEAMREVDEAMRSERAREVAAAYRVEVDKAIEELAAKVVAIGGQPDAAYVPQNAAEWAAVMARIDDDIKKAQERAAKPVTWVHKQDQNLVDVKADPRVPPNAVVIHTVGGYASITWDEIERTPEEKPLTLTQKEPLKYQQQVTGWTRTPPLSPYEPLIDGRTLAQVMEIYERRLRNERSPTRTFFGDLGLTFAQLDAARAEWSRQLREKQAEARRKEREQVVVDLDWD